MCEVLAKKKMLREVNCLERRQKTQKWVRFFREEEIYIVTIIIVGLSN